MNVSGRARLWLAVSASAVVFSMTGAGATAQAAVRDAATGYAAPAAARFAAPVLVKDHPADLNVPCWTSFVYYSSDTFAIEYRNCGTSTDPICPIYVQNPASPNSGTNYSWCSEENDVQQGQVAIWYFNQSYLPGFSLATDGGIQISGESTGKPCYTSFSNNNPDGKSFLIFYNNCSSDTEAICPMYIGNPASINNGANYIYCDSVTGVQPDTTAEWTVPAPSPTPGDYTTSFWIGKFPGQ